MEAERAEDLHLELEDFLVEALRLGLGAGVLGGGDAEELEFGELVHAVQAVLLSGHLLPEAAADRAESATHIKWL